MIDTANKIRDASSDDNPIIKLEALVYQLSAQGLTRQMIYDLYLQYLISKQDSEEWIAVQHKFNGDHPVENILDRLSGWCISEHTLLSNEPFQNR
jgi:hypothetical protein